MICVSSFVLELGFRCFTWAAYIVKHTNNNLKITFLDGLGNLLGLIIAMMLNNIATHIFIVSAFVYYNYCSET